MKKETFYCDMCKKEILERKYYLDMHCEWCSIMLFRHEFDHLCEQCAKDISEAIDKIKKRGEGE